MVARWAVRIPWLMALAGLAGCATRIVPPANPASPVAVYVADYGRHSSILLPTGNALLLEYSYGDWDYYALSNYRWYLGATKLFLSEGSGLGRRYLPYPNDEQELQRTLSSKRLLRIDIERHRVLALLDELEERYNGHIDSLIYNEDQGTYFVKDDSHYSLLHTCNQETAAWLERLGCGIEGWAVLSNFRVAGHHDSAGRPTTRPSAVDPRHASPLRGQDADAPAFDS
jgi:hypothetical protein